MTRLYMLDTDITSYLIRSQHPKLQAHFNSVHPSSIFLSSVVRAELVYGLKKLPSYHRLHVEVPYFLNTVRVPCWDEKCSDSYAEIRHRLTTSGQPIGELDMMIAAQAMALEATLVTNNTRHYQRIPLPLALENWAT